MQQTDKYKLNKPGVDDPIAIAPLNENMEKVEAALAAEAAERQTAIATEAAARETALSALDGAVCNLQGRVTTLEAGHVKLAIGVYTGNGATQTIQVGFTPRAIWTTSGKAATMLITEEVPFNDGTCSFDAIAIVEGGFRLQRDSHSNNNVAGWLYPFVAIA